MSDPPDIDLNNVSPSTSVNVAPEEKIEWLQAVNENDEYKDLTHLIKTAVRHELDDNFGFLQNQQNNTQEVNVDLTSVEDSLDTIESRLSRIEADIDVVTQTPDAEVERGSDEFYRIAGQVHDMLPLVDSEEKFLSLKTELGLPINEQAKITGYVEDIAAAIDEDESVVRDAAVYLSEQYESVDSTVDDGRRRFYELK